MGTLLSFPKNAWEMARQQDMGPSNGLLAALSFLRDALESNTHTMDDDLTNRCLRATNDALLAAMHTERQILHQALRLEEVEHLSRTDELTGAYNRRAFDQEFKRVLAAADRYGETGVLIYVDLDGFKPINDTYGHAAGDLVLCEVTRILQENVREHDFVARLGGDEYGVLLTRTTWKNGLERAELLKHLLNTASVKWHDKNIAVRASLGFQRFGPDDCDETLLKKADSAMYQAKRLRAKRAPVKA
ncbi:GGDEF domain-containing protein [Magnetovibrio sp. PR-2]|uniref:GGDEF domain-containing protein n=1 Tax=Magnetovibrio sp. PR-2 TaxID=3120356 RepID=UPI002FCE465F